MDSQIYQEAKGSMFVSQGKRYDLNKLFRLTHHLEIQDISVDNLKWMTEHPGHDVDQARVTRADLKTPIVVARIYGRWVVIDGFHRLLKAIQQNVKTLPGRIISTAHLAGARIPPGTPGWKKW